jgi:Zn-dependent M28 family amino/carboxypeptidase
VYQNSATDGFATMTHSGSGEVSAPAQGVDLALGTPSWPAAPAATTSASEASDFTGFIPGNIAVVQAGACEPSVKVENAVAAGAAGVVMAGQGHSALGMLTLVANLGGTDVDIPVVGASHNLAAGLAGATAVRLEVNVISETRSSENVLAETPTGDPDNVVMVGGHLDSVPAGPGINDNGSGSAAILETAIQMKRVETRNKVRFAWWGAEEPGLLGSQHYVDNLDDPAKDRIAVYLNFDMVGSLNYVFGVYDGNESTYAQSDGLVPAGSADVEKTFEDYFDMIGVPHEDTAFTGRSDYGPFIAEGIPSGGLLSGADGIKTLHDAAIYGGMVGKPHDPCYHRECDNSENVSLMALDINSDAVAHATLTHAMSTTLPG